VFEIKGLDELSKKLDDLAERAETVNGTQEVPLSELLSSTQVSGPLQGYSQKARRSQNEAREKLKQGPSGCACGGPTPKLGRSKPPAGLLECLDSSIARAGVMQSNHCKGGDPTAAPGGI
jgi:hypothetical protein